MVIYYFFIGKNRLPAIFPINRISFGTLFRQLENLIIKELFGKNFIDLILREKSYEVCICLKTKYFKIHNDMQRQWHPDWIVNRHMYLTNVNTIGKIDLRLTIYHEVNAVNVPHLFNDIDKTAKNIIMLALWDHLNFINQILIICKSFNEFVIIIKHGIIRYWRNKGPFRYPNIYKVII